MTVATAANREKKKEKKEKGLRKKKIKIKNFTITAALLFFPLLLVFSCFSL